MILNEGKRHFFSVDIAVKLGLDAAILAEHFAFWIEKNEVDGNNFREGRYWIFCSVSSLQKVFPYLSIGKIRGALNTLLDKGVIIKGNFNKLPYDRTLWYSFSDDYYKFNNSICKNQQMECEKFTNEISDFCKPIPDIEPDIEPDNTPHTPQRGDCTEPEPVSAPPVISLPLNDRTEYGISPGQLLEWQNLYPAVDVMQQLRNMLGWLNSNPGRRKTKRGILRFVTSWLSKEQDKGGTRPAAYTQQPKKSWAEVAREIDEDGK